MGVGVASAILKASCSGVRDAIRSASRRASSCSPSLCLTCASRRAARGSSPPKVPLSACASLYACAASNSPCLASARATTAPGESGLTPSPIISFLVFSLASNSAPEEALGSWGYVKSGPPRRVNSACCCEARFLASKSAILRAPMSLAFLNSSRVRGTTPVEASGTFSVGYPNCA